MGSEELTPEQAAEWLNWSIEEVPESLRDGFIHHLTEWLLDRGHFREFAALARRRGWRDEVIYALLTGHARNANVDPLWPWLAVYVLPSYG
jgi:hypothetical protein